MSSQVHMAYPQERGASTIEGLASFSAMSSPTFCNGDARTPSPAEPQARTTSGMTSTPPMSSLPPLHAPRPRHHVRSFSAEKRFAREDAKFPQPNGNGLPSYSAQVEKASPAMFSPPPTRAKRSPSIESFAAANSSAEMAGRSSSPSSTSPNASSGEMSLAKRDGGVGSPEQSHKRESSPPKTESGTARSGSADEREQVAKLRLAQANRRPRVQRLTPAFSSLPSRASARIVLNQGESPSGSLPVKDASSTRSVDFPTAQEGDNELKPGVGLQIDLACIPSPSLADLHGPVSTSQIEPLIKDRHGNPVKPSLKNSRSGIVGHNLPGRSSRSDSTPSLPLSLSKSVPTTPTVVKNVKFDNHLEHVKLFKNRQRPTAVSRDGSPEQTETETEEEKEMYPYIWSRAGAAGSSSGLASYNLSPKKGLSAVRSPTHGEEQLVLKLPNFPSSTRLSTARNVFLERIYLADDLRSVKGSVQVRNMSFEKWVAIRYTLDHWATIGEVSADYTESIKGGQADRFSFSIKLNELLNWPRGSSLLETKSMFICVRYTSSGQEFWDNNDNLNYQLDFRRRPAPTTPASTPAMGPVTPQAGSGQSNATKARILDMARHGVGGKGVFAMEDLRRELEKLRDDDDGEDSSLRLQALGASDPKTRRRALAAIAQSGFASASPPKSPDARSSSPSMWSARYDFGRSLRDSGKGSRTTEEGRAAALDYFSARPNSASHGRDNGSGSYGKADSRQLSIAGDSPVQSTPLGSSESPVASSARPAPPSSGETPAFMVSAASPPFPSREFSDNSIYSSVRPGTFDARFGMYSPGIDETVHHMPTNMGSRTPSASNTPSPGQTPTLGASGLPTSSANSSVSVSPESPAFPMDRRGHRHALSVPASGHALHQRTQSLPMSNSSPLSNHSDTLSSTNISIHDGKGESVDETPSLAPRLGKSSSEDSSTPSEGGSPNPFSPSVSVSSIESDATISPSDGKGSLPAASSSGHGTSSRWFPTPSKDTEERLRPASMSDYNELVSRFCWNADMIPSGGSMVSAPSGSQSAGVSKNANSKTLSASMAAALSPGPSVSKTSSEKLSPQIPTSPTVDHRQLYDFRGQNSGHGSGGSSGSGASTPTLT